MSESRVREAFRRQSQACRSLGSPLTASICETLANALQASDGAVAARVLGWQGDPLPSADSVPLRLCGGLHALVLTSAAPDLAAGYAAGAVNAGLLLSVLTDHEAFLLHWLDSPPQTNEVARSAAIIAAARFVAGRCGLPFRALELGASAGLNLNFARYTLRPEGALPPSPDGDSPGIFLEEELEGVVLRPRWEGTVPRGAFNVAQAEGVDLRPVDAVADGLRLMAYCWPDQGARLARLRGALALARAHPPQVAAGDAGDWLAARLAEVAPGQVTFVYHTVASQYFPAATQMACEAALQRAARSTTPNAALAHFSMEADGRGDGAALELRLWNGGAHRWSLGRADFHGRWLRWQPEPLPAGL